jgi:hypothetical protein
MPHASHATLIGSLGVALLLIAFLANLLELLRADSRLYTWLNFVGASLAGWSSYLIGFMPFVVMEGVWALVALWAIVRGSTTRGSEKDDAREGG